jgi:hypothetical protein
MRTSRPVSPSHSLNRNRLYAFAHTPVSRITHMSQRRIAAVWTDDALFCAARRGERTLDRYELRLAQYFYSIVLEVYLSE